MNGRNFSRAGERYQLKNSRGPNDSKQHKQKAIYTYTCHNKTVSTKDRENLKVQREGGHYYLPGYKEQQWKP